MRAKLLCVALVWFLAAGCNRLTRDHYAGTVSDTGLFYDSKGTRIWVKLAEHKDLLFLVSFDDAEKYGITARGRQDSFFPGSSDVPIASASFLDPPGRSRDLQPC
jgi:hypothetical protein